MRTVIKKNALTPKTRAVALRFLNLGSTKEVLERVELLAAMREPTAPVLNKHIKSLPSFMRPHKRVLRRVLAVKRTQAPDQFSTLRLYIPRSTPRHSNPKKNHA